MGTVRAICMQAIGADGIVGSFDRGHGRGRAGAFLGVGAESPDASSTFSPLYETKKRGTPLSYGHLITTSP